MVRRESEYDSEDSDSIASVQSGSASLSDAEAVIFTSPRMRGRKVDIFFFCE